jgi:C4-dicarboxylate-specific signal transduction histidine kinase
LGLLVHDKKILTGISVVKGIFFIALTSIILYHLISRYVRQLEELNRSLESRVSTTVAELREKDQMLIQQSRMAAMGEMLGNIAHQWRQPLNTLGLLAQQLEMFHESGELGKEMLEPTVAKMMGIVLHLSRTIDDFRDFSCSGKEKVPFSLDQVVAKTISLVEESFREQQISMVADISGNLQLNGYPNEYAQVILNILMNARDELVGRRTGDARIWIAAWKEEGRTVVTIADNAGGIREEIMDKIFDAFFTTKELGKGTGVGLFMSKNIIEKIMGGRLTARNTRSGAEFRIEV